MRRSNFDGPLEPPDEPADADYAEYMADLKADYLETRRSDGE